MPTIRLVTDAPWRFQTRLWPRHRPLMAETQLGPFRIVRVLSEEDAERALERQSAMSFAAQQRARR